METPFALLDLFWGCIGHGQYNMMTSSNGNIFRVTGLLCGEFTGHRWIPHKGQWRGALMFSFICACINGWVNNREAGDLRSHRAHYDVIVMKYKGFYNYTAFEVHVHFYIDCSSKVKCRLSSKSCFNIHNTELGECLFWLLHLCTFSSITDWCCNCVLRGGDTIQISLSSKTRT